MATETKTKKAPAKTAKPKAAPKAMAAGEASIDLNAGLHRRKLAVGTVISNKMQKTIVVKVDRRVIDPLYKKYVTRSRHFKAHDEKNDAKMGDIVSIIECRPMSRDKRWALQKIVRRAEQTADANV